MKLRKIIFLVICAATAATCSTTRALKDGEYLLRKNKVVVNDKNFNTGEVTAYISQKPNSFIFGVNPLLSVYNWGGNGDNGFKRFLQKVGIPPVVYDGTQVEKSVNSIENHLRYIGYYGSQVESRVQVKGRKVYVTYYVALGKRYKISAIDYQLPSYGTFKQDFEADIPKSTVKTGEYLSESTLEAEAERSSGEMRNKGYYGFTKSFYAFEADTLAGDGNANLTIKVRDYALGDNPSSARPHNKYTIGQVQITRPKSLKLRNGMLENMNTLRPGQMYSEKEVNTTYARFASVGMLSGVNVNMTPAGDNVVDATIALRNSRLQAVKLGLEGSFNSSGLFGISPQLNYLHKNIFFGGEQLNIGIKGNFQFKPGENAYSTDVSVVSSIRFPQAIGLPNRLFTGPNIPTTEVAISFSYQDRPEFRRTLYSTSFQYNGRVGNNRFFYQAYPLRVNVTRMFNINEDFLTWLIQNNPFLLSAYSDRFDMGISGMVYYTTNSSAVPLTPFHYIRFGFDLSGNFLSLFNNLMQVDEYGERLILKMPYAQYVRAEVNMGKVFRFGRKDKHAIALHFMAGAGYAYGNSTSLPIEKHFFCGGSTSMRGWQARTLGPGNEAVYDGFAIPSQVGEMKLEANVEYRFPIVWKLEGALFADAGNIWDIKRPNTEDVDDASYFNIKTLPEATGLDWGLGIRLNLDFILIRLDTGVRLHDPVRPAGNRWVPVKEWFPGNYAIHFGVGYPF